MSDQPDATPQGSADRAPLKRYDIAAWYDWETSECGLDEHEHPEGDWVRYADVCAEREAQEAELAELQRWKREALAVLNNWEEVRPLVSARLGESLVNATVAELTELRRINVDREDQIAIQNSQIEQLKAVRDEERARVGTELERLREVERKYRALGSELVESLWGEGPALDDYGAVFDFLEPHGVIVKHPEPYDPDKHGHVHEDVAPGDEWYQLAWKVEPQPQEASDAS